MMLILSICFFLWDNSENMINERVHCSLEPHVEPCTEKPKCHVIVIHVQEHFEATYDCEFAAYDRSPKSIAYKNTYEVVVWSD